MDGEKIIIQNVKVEYITTKIDAYDNMNYAILNLGINILIQS